MRKSYNYTYDNAGNLLTITDPESNKTTYTYDELNRMATDTNQLGFTRTYGYDKVGNLIKTSDRNDREIEYQYDSLDRLTAEIWLDEASNPVHTINYNYDGASQLTSAADVFSAYGYEYDDAGRLISLDNAGTPEVPNVVFDYSYDAAYNMTGVTDSIDGVDGGVETYSYDALNRVTSISQSGNGVVDKRVDYEYDKASQRIATNRYNSLTEGDSLAITNYTYDDNGRLTSLINLNDNGEIANYGYKYDADNRITEFASSLDGTSTYTYDRTDQLTEADREGHEDENYTYDDNGNRINDGYDTGEDNQLLTDGVYNYQYDGEGNRTSQTEIATGIVTEYEWDYRNRLVGVITKNGSDEVIKAIEYTYDVNDQRIAKSADLDGDGANEAEIERYVLDGGEIALVFDGDGNQTERFFHGVGVDEVLAQEDESGEVLWALTDHQGSVRVLMDNTGAVVNQISYDSLGNVTAQTNVGESFRFTYTGREFDSETGLYYYRTRYLEPETGLFISQDGIGFSGGNTNLYGYVGNSPTNYTDPSGNIPAPVILFGVGFAFDSAVQIIQNRGFDNYDWKQSVQTGLSTAIAGPVAGKILGPGASLASKVVVNAIVGGVVDGGLQLTRNKLEGKCDVFEDVGQQAITGAVGGAFGEVAEVGLKSAAKGVKGLFKNTDEVAEGVAKNGAKNADAGDVVADRVLCFVAGTLVATPIGFVPIEEIRAGDKVYGGTKEYPGGIFRVRQLFQRQVDKVLDVVVNGVTITCTPEHPFWVEGYGWVIAEDLEPGYWLLTKDGLNLPIDSVTRRECQTTVYNFEMDEYHTYYVSKLALLSHNMCETPLLPGSASIGNLQPTNNITDDFLDSLNEEARNIHKAMVNEDVNTASRTIVVAQIAELSLDKNGKLIIDRKISVASNNGAYSKNVQDYLDTRYTDEVLRTSGVGRGGWHAEGRIIKDALNKSNNGKVRIVEAIGVSQKFCPHCAADVARHGSLTTQSQHLYKDYTGKLPKYRPYD